VSASESTSRVVLITGATSGIGRHAALHLARKGHHVFATGRREDALESVMQAAAGTALETLRLDVTDAASIRAAIEAIERSTSGHGVDVLVNNAGYGCLGALEDIDDDALKRQYETNVFGLMAVTRAVLPKMRARRDGRVINMSSIGGRVTFPFMGAYHSTKSAVESLSDALRRELAAFGIRVVVIEPGVIQTDFGERAMDTLSRPRPDSAYTDVYANARAVHERFQREAIGPEHTSRAIERAITTRSPRARYAVPWGVRLAIAIFALLPTTWADALVRAQFAKRPERTP